MPAAPGGTAGGCVREPACAPRVAQIVGGHGTVMGREYEVEEDEWWEEEKARRRTRRPVPERGEGGGQRRQPRPRQNANRRREPEE